MFFNSLLYLAGEIQYLHAVVCFRMPGRRALGYYNYISLHPMSSKPGPAVRIPVFRVIRFMYRVNAVGKLQAPAGLLLRADACYPDREPETGNASGSGAGEGRDKDCCRGDMLKCPLNAQGN